MKYVWLGIIGVCLVFAACEKIVGEAPAEDELLDGPVSGLTTDETRRFLAGDVAFNDDIFTPTSGLGPIFVATSCGSCHAGDGKGHPFTTLTRFGQGDTNGNLFLNQGGPQLQNRACPGYQPEQIPAGAPRANFTPPANTGLGFLEALGDDQILANSDPNDLNGDGISGRPNYITPPHYFLPTAHHVPYNGKYIGRFGKKAAAITLQHQTVNAYNQDMGITSVFSSIDTYTGHEVDPEVSTNTLNNVVFYLKTLKAPVQRTPNDAEVQAGKKIFNNIECNKCHISDWTSGFSEVAALSRKEFHPYTDLLLHDMGDELNDGYTEGKAMTPEWRTPPLWGLGLSKNSQGGAYYLLHDGRATSIEKAIEYHGGEGAKSRAEFRKLNDSEKVQLVKFLESL